MKKDKIKNILKIIVSIFVTALILICASFNIIFAIDERVSDEEHYEDEEGTEFIWMRDLAHYGYEKFSSLTIREIFNIRSSDPTGSQGTWNDCASVCCLHNQNKTDKYQNQAPFLIIDVNPEGDDPKAARMYIYNRAEKDPSLQITAYDLTGDGYGTYYAMLAYVSAHAEMSHVFDENGNVTNETIGVSADVKWSNAFRTVWMDIVDHLQTTTNDSVTFPIAEEGYWSENYPGYIEAKNYVSKLSTTDTTYSARIIVFQGGSNETRAVLTGIENVIETPTINKWISKVKVPSKYEYGEDYNGNVIVDTLEYQNAVNVKYKRSNGTTYTRENMTEVQKTNNSVNLTPYTYVTYTIKASMNKAGTYTVVDQFDYYLCEYVPEQSSNWTLNESDLTGHSNTLSITQKFEANKVYTFTVTLYVISRDNTTTPIENRATLGTASSSDFFSLKGESKYIYSDAKGSYSKSIVAVNGQAVDNRSGYTNDTAKANPITVKKGDVVTYRVSIANTSESYVDIISAVFIDTMEDGLQLEDGRKSFEITFNQVNAGQTKTYEFKAVVTKSNMYLQPIENKVVLNRGNFYRKITEIFNYDIESIDGLKNVDFKYITFSKENININSFDQTMNKDYIQLDDVEISGYVWNDVNKDGIKDSSEKGVDGVKVYLHSSRTAFLLEENSHGITYDDSLGLYYVTTDQNGYYSFGKVKKGNSDFEGGSRKYKDNSGYVDYYLTYEYSGIYYESTIYTDLTDVTDSGPINNWINKSHASEDLVSATNRKDFNSKFETISYNKALDSENANGNSIDLSYDKNGHVSQLEDTENTHILSRSPNLFKYNSNGKSFDSIIKDESYLRYMNLGLITREQADLELSKDVVDAVVEVNGFKTTYTYESLSEGKYTGDYKLSTPYKLLVYEEDYNFRTNLYDDVIANIKGQEDNDLKITLTYKITVTNVSPISDYYTTVREIIDTSTSEMTLNRIYDVDGNSYDYSSQSTYNNTADYNYSGYNTVFITGSNLTNKQLAQNQSLEIYLEYSVNKIDGAIIIDSENDIGKANIAQIGAFSVYVNNGSLEPAGVVDKDSNPGNLRQPDYDITDDSIYEDDTFYTTIQILLRDDSTETTPDPDPDPEPDPDPGTTPDPGEPEDPDDPNDPTPYSYRQISGNVWEDLDTEESSLGEEFGDGIKNSNENGAKGIIVKLLEVVSDGNKDYYIDTGIWTTTDEDGNYTLESSERLHAGTYVIRFIYGNNPDNLSTTDGNTIRYSGQDYKSTSYTYVGESGNETETVEAADFKATKDELGEVSVAKDNELRRLEVISYSTTMTYTLDTVLKSNSIAADDGTVTQVGNMNALAENTSMYADTKKFNIQIEYNDYYTDFIDLIFNGLTFRNYKVKEVNFGLIERPKTKLQLMNDMVEMIATTSDGNELVHLYFDIVYYKDGDTIAHKSVLNEARSIGNENVQILNRSSSSQGFRYVNIDTDLLQGLEVMVKYKLAIANISDIDTSYNNLLEMVKNYDVGNVAEYMKSQTISNNDEVYRYGEIDNSEVSDTLLTNYNYNELVNAIDEMAGSEYLQYVTDENYDVGDFLGKTYYANDFSRNNTVDDSNDKIVETRVDQIIDYIDNDLVFRYEDNTNNEGVGKFVNYTMSEIAERELLAGITEDSVISDGKQSYITGEKNNLAFSVESQEINPNMYKFLPPITDDTATHQESLVSKDADGNTITENVNAFDDSDLYVIDVSGSRYLSSEEDAEGLSIDNLAEIVKITNSVGRKAYVSTSKTNSTGYIGNTSLSVGEIEDPEKEVSITTVAGESDTDYAEYTTFSPPTGYTQNEVRNQTIVKTIAIMTSALALIAVSIIVFIKFGPRKRFYR